LSTPPSFEAILIRERLRRDEVSERFYDGLSWFPPATTGLVAVCVLVYGLSVCFEGLAGLPWPLLAWGPRQPEVLLLLGARQDLAIASQPWRLLSCAWLHGGPLHLLLNGLALYGLGRICETLYGPVRLLTLFLVSALTGSLLSWLGGVPLSVGASGAVFGLLGAGMVFGLRHRRDLPRELQKVLGWSLAPWIALNLAIGLLPMLPIDNWAHLGGLGGGLLVAAVLGDKVVGEPPSPRATWALGLLCAPLLLWPLVEVALASARFLA
jgi:rhomboid protease GluP